MHKIDWLNGRTFEIAEELYDTLAIERIYQQQHYYKRMNNKVMQAKIEMVKECYEYLAARNTVEFFEAEMTNNWKAYGAINPSEDCPDFDGECGSTSRYYLTSNANWEYEEDCRGC